MCVCGSSRRGTVDTEVCGPELCRAEQVSHLQTCHPEVLVPTRLEGPARKSNPGVPTRASWGGGGANVRAWLTMRKHEKRFSMSRRESSKRWGAFPSPWGAALPTSGECLSQGTASRPLVHTLVRPRCEP